MNSNLHVLIVSQILHWLLGKAFYYPAPLTWTIEIFYIPFNYHAICEVMQTIAPPNMF